MQRIARLTPWIVAGAGALAAIVVLYPGQYPFDSAYQLWQARSGQFNDVSPVVMPALWSALLALGGGPALLLCVNLAMLWSGIALCVAAISESAPWRAVLVIVFGMAPLTMVQMAHLLSDSHLAAVLALATGLAARGLATGRKAPMLACALALVYAGCVRHNALPAILPYAAVLVPVLFAGSRHRWRMAFLAALALGGVSFGAGIALDRALTTERATVWPSIALWDLAAISVDRGVLLLPAFTHGPGLTVDELRSTGAFDPASNTLLYQRGTSGVRDGLGEPYSTVQLRQLRRAWIDAVLSYPGAYLRHRLRITWLLIGPHRGAVQGAAYFIARSTYRDDPPLPQPWAPQAQQRLYAIAAALLSTWLFAGLPYLLLSGLGVVIGALRRERPMPCLAMVVGSSALLYAAGFTLAAPGAELRYLTWPIIAGPLALALSLSRRGAFSSRGPGLRSRGV